MVRVGGAGANPAGGIRAAPIMAVMNPSTGPGFGNARAWAFRFGGPGFSRVSVTERAAAFRGRMFEGRGPFGRVVVGILSLLVAVPVFFLLLGIAFLVFVLVLVVAALAVAFGLVRAVARSFGAGGPRGAQDGSREDPLDAGRENVRVVRRME